MGACIKAYEIVFQEILRSEQSHLPDGVHVMAHRSRHVVTLNNADPSSRGSLIGYFFLARLRTTQTMLGYTLHLNFVYLLFKLPLIILHIFNI